MGKVGASSFSVDQPIWSADATYHPSTAYGDGVPSIHVGFSDLAAPTLATPEDADGAGYYLAGRHDPHGNFYFRVAYEHELLRTIGVGTTPDDPVKDNRLMTCIRS
jgi:hypothetical protein